jgi:predicted GIY-YIG superfamily endonuclease
MMIVPLPRVPGVYAIVNTLNNKRLICFSRNMKHNAEISYSCLNRGKGPVNSSLQSDWDEDSSNFKLEVLEETDNRDRLHYYIRKYNSIESGYNKKYISDSRLYKHLPKESGVYQILNTVNGKLYIGFSSDIQRRVRDHFGELRRGDHNTGDLQKDWNLGHRFVAGTLEMTDDVSREEYFIKIFKSHLSSGYNILTRDGRFKVI